MGIELLGLLGGAVTRLFSWYAEYKQKKQDNEHELALIDKQISLANIQHEQKVEEIKVQSDANVDVEWAKALSVALEAPHTGNPTVDALNALVRPLITIWWALILYSISKVILVVVAFQNHATLKEFASIVVSDFDISIIGAILGFWFVNRTIAQGHK